MKVLQIKLLVVAVAVLTVKVIMEDVLQILLWQAVAVSAERPSLIGRQDLEVAVEAVLLLTMAIPDKAHIKVTVVLEAVEKAGWMAVQANPVSSTLGEVLVAGLI